MATILAIAGPLIVAANWLLVRSGRVSIWVANAAVMTGAALMALASGVVEPTRGAPVATAVVVGVGSGAVLYAATAAFMSVAGGWAPLARHTRELYRDQGDRGTLSLPAAVTISAVVVAPGEELLWRGVVLEVIRDPTGSLVVAGVVTWVAYVVANAFSGSIPIVLGAAVSGAVWTLLAITGFGLVAAIGCHAVWTSLMIVRPPVPAAR